MTRLKPLSVIDQAEIALRQGLSRRKWTGTLPSFATLSEFLGVSVPTVSLAVARLARAGLVASQGNRRRYRIEPLAHRGRVRKGGMADRAAETRYLLMVGPVAREQLDSWRSRMVMDITRELRRIGWVCDYDLLPFAGERTRRASWDRVLARHPATHLLVLDGIPPVVHWARSRGLNIALMGGQSIPGIPSLGVDLDAVLGLVVGKLADLGHRRVMVPVTEGSPALAKAVARAAAKPLGFTPEQMLDRGLVGCLPARTADEQRAGLAARLSRLRPTALLCMSWRDYLVAADVARDLRISIPRDLSVIALDSNPDMQWVKPAPASFSLGPDVVVSGVVDWISSRRGDASAPTRRMLNGWVEGETLAAPPVSVA